MPKNLVIRASSSLARSSALKAAALILAACALLCLAWKRLLIGGRVPLDGNMIAMTYPNWRLARSLWEHPHLPLWNPLRNMGEPYLADPQTAALYPPLWMLSMVPDFQEFLRLWVVLHTLLASVFMGLLARKWYKNWTAAVTAAVIAGLNGFFMGRATFTGHFASAAWLGAVLYFQSGLAPSALGVSIALQWLAGFPPFSILSLLAAALLAADQGKDGWRCLLRGVVLGAGLSAIQWLPFLELLGQSGRGLILNGELATQYSVPAGQLLKMLLMPQWRSLSPEVSGDPAIVSFYTGLPVLGLALWGVLRGGPRERGLLFVLAAALALSLGGNLPGYRLLAPLRVFRFPANWLLLATAAMGLLGAAGMSRVRALRLRWGLAIGVVMDLLYFAQQPRVAWSRPAFLADTPALARHLSAAGGRIYHTESLRRVWERGYLESEEDYLLMRDFLAPSFGTAFGAREAGSYQTLALKRALTYRRRMSERPSPLLDWAGISTVVDLEPGAGRVERKNLRVLANSTAKSPLFFLEGSIGKVQGADYFPGRARAKVTVSKPATLVFSEMDYPGWRARMDGQGIPHGRFEQAFLSVQVPPGEHEIEFEFSPRSFRIGSAVSAAALLWLAAVF